MTDKRRRVCEDSHFSTGNGGATMQIVRDSYGPEDAHPHYLIVHKVSHYGLTQASESMIHDIGVMDEMIAMMQRARAAMAAEKVTPGYPGGASISRNVTNSIRIVRVPVKAEIEGDAGCESDESISAARTIMRRTKVGQKTRLVAVPASEPDDGTLKPSP